jgi:hypothetical protein
MLLAILLLIASGALLRPVPVLTLTDGRSQITVRLNTAQTYDYSYVNSVYLAPVVEHHRVVDGRVRITSVEATDIRAVEYFHWDGEIRPTALGYAQTAPFWEATHLTIRVVHPYQQWLGGEGWSVDLEERFADGVVEVKPERLPWLAALVRGAHP